MTVLLSATVTSGRVGVQDASNVCLPWRKPRHLADSLGLECRRRKHRQGHLLRKVRHYPSRKGSLPTPPRPTRQQVPDTI